MKGDDGLRTANYLEEKLLTQYRQLDERNQQSARKWVGAMLRAATTAAPPARPRRTRGHAGMSDSDTLKQWARDMGRRARQGKGER